MSKKEIRICNGCGKENDKNKEKIRGEIGYAKD